MRYKKNINEALDNEFSSSSKFGFSIRLAKNVVFYRKGLHWEYVENNDIERIYRRIEPVSSYGSCCADSMDIQWLIIILKNGIELKLHICDGEEKMAEDLYSRIQTAWTNVEYGKPSLTVV